MTPSTNINDQLDDLQQSLSRADSVWCEARDQLLVNGPAAHALDLLATAGVLYVKAGHHAQMVAHAHL